MKITAIALAGLACTLGVSASGAASGPPVRETQVPWDTSAMQRAKASKLHTRPPHRAEGWFDNLKGGGHKGRKGHEGRQVGDMFSEHFSSPTTFTSLYYQKAITDMYEGQQVTTVRELAPRSFDVLGWVAAHLDSGEVHFAADPDVEVIETALYLPPERRLEGHGRIAKQVWLSGYNAEVAGESFKLIETTYPEGYGVVTQWYIVGDEAKALTFAREVFIWSTQIQDSILVYDNGWWSPDPALWRSVQKASWDDVILEDTFKRRLQNEYRLFFKSEDQYRKFGIPWKRGLMFLGPPGNGKTISLKALMKDVGVPALYVKTLASYGLPGGPIRQVFERARAEAPCVLIFEDLDSMITPSNRAFFLNELDGLEDNDGLLMVGTTNHFDRLDPSLSNRPSRFDRKYKFDNPTRDERRMYAVYWRNKLADNKHISFPEPLLDKVADETDKFSFAYLKEAFVAALINLVNDDADFETALMEQIKFLRDELESGEPDVAGAGAGAGPSPWAMETGYDGGYVDGYVDVVETYSYPVIIPGVDSTDGPQNEYIAGHGLVVDRSNPDSDVPWIEE